MTEITLNVKGMMCAGCEKRIVSALTEIENIMKVVANHENGLVIIKTSGEVNINDIEEKIDDLGFEVVKAD